MYGLEGIKKYQKKSKLKDHFKDTYEQKLQDKERIIESKDVIISLLQAKINELLEKEK